MFDVAILRSEPCLLQHKLLVCRLVVRHWVPKKKSNFVRNSKMHKLKEVNVLREFQKRVSEGAGSRNAEATNVEGVWNELKSCLIDSAREACGESKGPPMHKETWWWNNECAKVVEEKKKLFEVMKKSETGVDISKAEMEKSLRTD